MAKTSKNSKNSDSRELLEALTILEKEKSVKEAAEELLNTALEHGGVDNVTVILVEVQQEEERKR